MVGWGQTAQWTGATTGGVKEFTYDGTAPDIPSNLSVRRYTTYASQGYSTDFPDQSNSYRYSVHLSQTDAQNGINALGENTWINVLEGNATYYVRVSMRRNSTNTRRDILQFKIVPKALAATDFTLSKTEDTYTGAKLNPTVTTSLTADDYDVVITDEENATVTDLIDAGTYTYTFTGKGNYTGEQTKTFTINKAPATSSLTFTPEVGLTYNGGAQALVTTPWTGTYAGGDLVFSVDGENWDEDFYKQVNAGDYTLSYKIAGDKNHTDTQAQEIGISSVMPRKLTTAMPGLHWILQYTHRCPVHSLLVRTWLPLEFLSNSPQRLRMQVITLSTS